MGIKLPYGKQQLDESDIEAVVDVLRSDWLTTGPLVARFEEAVAEMVGAGYAVAVSSGTAALHTMLAAVGVGSGDEVIVPAITFAATANAVLYQGGTPVFADIDERDLILSPESVRDRMTPATKAIIAVDYAGQPADYRALYDIANAHGIQLLADACHALGGARGGQKCGALADLTAFSFHPVKPITTGEGGMVTTDDAVLASRMRRFRNHGIATDHVEREKDRTWFYEMVELGHNYRITDMQCALGLSQMKKLPVWLAKRRTLATHYDRLLEEVKNVTPLKVHDHVEHGYHLYVVRIARGLRNAVFKAMRESVIGVHVHYIPVYLHPYYQQHLGFSKGLCPVAERVYDDILTLPLHTGMTPGDVERVVECLRCSLDGMD